MRAIEPRGRVWDWPVRVGHWLLAAGFVMAWLTGDSEEQRLIHVYAGSLMLGIVSFRLLWGFIGTAHARFGDFLRGPRAVAGYLKSLLRGRPEHFTGHNPAGGWAIIALLTLISLSGVSGWLNYQELAGEWTEKLHEIAVDALLAVVALHLCGVLLGSLAHRENLARSMLTGIKRGHAAAVAARPIAALAMLLWAVALAWLLGG